MNPDLIYVLTRLTFALLALAFLIIFQRVQLSIEEKAKSGQATDLDLIIDDFVAAAEQLLRKDDPDGSKRKQYVIDCLTELGIIITNEIDARIEGSVFRQNLRIKAAQK